MDDSLHNQKLLKAIELLEESQRIARVGGWALDIRSGDLSWTAETYRIHDISPEEFTPTLDACLGYFLPESQHKIRVALDAAIHQGTGYDLELEIHTTTGRKIDVRATCVVTLHEGVAIKLAGTFQDISDQKAIQRELENTNHDLQIANSILESIANYDILTGLPNRALLADRMQQMMILSNRQATSVAIAFLDLDGYKDVNDTYGHDIGDAVLLEIALRLKKIIRRSDTLARFGGDEFVAVMGGFDHPSDCEPLLANMLSAASEKIILGDIQLKVTASIGVAIYPKDGTNTEQLLLHADQAMYKAKQLGKNCFHLFDLEKGVAIQAHHEELDHIRNAFESNEFCLLYQPKVNMHTGEVIGVEALIRWQDPNGHLLSPSEFLPCIANDQLSIRLGEWVICAALSQMENWRLSGLVIPVSVNIGALQLRQTDFAQRLEYFLKQFPTIKRHHFELEVLETSALSDITQVSKNLIDCQRLGVRLTLDNFGTGYSSLAYLKRLPTNFLKIDRSFVQGLLENADDLTMIQSIIGLAESFQRQTIAEGVESIAQGVKLISLGCMFAQGYYIAHPMPADEIIGWIKTWRPPPEWMSKAA